MDYKYQFSIKFKLIKYMTDNPTDLPKGADEFAEFFDAAAAKTKYASGIPEASPLQTSDQPLELSDHLANMLNQPASIRLNDGGTLEIPARPLPTDQLQKTEAHIADEVSQNIEEDLPDWISDENRQKLEKMKATLPTQTPPNKEEESRPTIQMKEKEDLAEEEPKDNPEDTATEERSELSADQASEQSDAGKQEEAVPSSNDLSEAHELPDWIRNAGWGQSPDNSNAQEDGGDNDDLSWLNDLMNDPKEVHDNPSFENLIFESAIDIDEAIEKIRPGINLSHKELQSLVGVHLWDEAAINRAINQANEHVDGDQVTPSIFRGQEVLTAIREYKQSNGLTLMINPAEFTSRFNVAGDVAQHFEGIDLSNNKVLLEAIKECGLSGDDGMLLYSRINQYTHGRVVNDLVAGSNDLGVEPTRPPQSADISRIYVPLGGNGVESIARQMRSQRIEELRRLLNNPPEEWDDKGDRRRSNLASAERIFNYLNDPAHDNESWKVFEHYAKKVWSEEPGAESWTPNLNVPLANILSADAPTPVAAPAPAGPESWFKRFQKWDKQFTQNLFKANKDLGQAMRTPKGVREWSVLGARIAADFVPEIGLLLMATNMSAMTVKEIRTIRKIAKEKARGESTWAKYVEQTTIGKLINKDAKSELTGRQRFMAAYVGALSSMVGIATSEAVSTVVRVPGVRGVARAAATRVVSQYIAPRAIDLMASAALKKTKYGPETETKKKEWVSLALSTSSLTSIAFTTLATGAVIGRAGTNFADVAHKTEESGHQLIEGLKTVNENSAKAQTLLDGTGETILHGVETGNGLVGGIKEAWEQNIAPAAEQVIHPLINNILPGANVPEVPKPETNNGEPVVTINPFEVKHNDVLEGDSKHESFDLNHDGKADAYFRFDPKTHEKIAAVTSDGTRLSFNPEAKGEAGLQVLFAKEHPDWNPDQIRDAASQAVRDGLTTADTAKVNSYSPQFQESPVILGKADHEIKVDGGSYWLDKSGNVVSANSDKFGWLQFDPNAKGGGEGWNQYELANSHRNDLQHYSMDQLINESHLAAAGKVDINNPIGMQNITDQAHIRMESETEHGLPDYDKLTKGTGFDTNNDGKADSWWLKDPVTGKDVTGELANGSHLYFDREHGGIEGVVQEFIHEVNPNLSPAQDASIANRIVSEVGVKPDDLNNLSQITEIQRIINDEVVRFSIQDYLVSNFSKFNISPSTALNVLNRINIHFDNGLFATQLPGIDVLNKLSVKIDLDGKSYNWNTAPWEQWLRDQGIIK